MNLKYFLKKPNFRHLDRLTTEIGLIQHTNLDIPDPKFGYSIDDNARALIVMAKYYLIFKDKDAFHYIRIYLNYLERALTRSGFFHNFADFHGNFIDKKGSTDSFGRTFWALSFVANAKLGVFSQKAKDILSKIDKHALLLEPLRTKSFIIIGYYNLKNKSKVSHIADELIEKFEKSSHEDWAWFENSLTYSNAAMCQALFYAYRLTRKKKYLNVALASFDFLSLASTHKGKPAPIGQAGWHERGKEKALYDQQAVDAGKMVSTSLLAYDITKDKKYLRLAYGWYMWFHKNNIAGVEMIEPIWGACYDGITPKGVNLNKGAESTLSYLMAYLDFSNLVLKK
ncbi:MAG: hypothetical protein WCW17_03530 [Patescibacteria group bacterium]|jgi:uncharacterized protein YyaL (SSP411 family)